MTPRLHERETLGSGNNRVADGLIEERNKGAVADADPCNWCVHAGAGWHMNHKQSAAQLWRPVKEEQAQ